MGFFTDLANGGASSGTSLEGIMRRMPSDPPKVSSEPTSPSGEDMRTVLTKSSSCTSAPMGSVATSTSPAEPRRNAPDSLRLRTVSSQNTVNPDPMRREKQVPPSHSQPLRSCLLARQMHSKA